MQNLRNVEENLFSPAVTNHIYSFIRSLVLHDIYDHLVTQHSHQNKFMLQKHKVNIDLCPLLLIVLKPKRELHLDESCHLTLTVLDLIMEVSFLFWTYRVNCNQMKRNGRLDIFNPDIILLTAVTRPSILKTDQKQFYYPDVISPKFLICHVNDKYNCLILPAPEA